MKFTISSIFIKKTFSIIILFNLISSTLNIKTTSAASKTTKKLSSELKSKNVFSFQNFYGEPPAPEKFDAVLGTETPGTILSEWLLISSKVFKSPNFFPEIYMGYDKENVKVKSDPNYFRINDAFGKDENEKNQPPSDKEFWFILRNNNIFYTSTKEDTNILGGVRIDHIQSVTSNKKNALNQFCLTINDISGFIWHLCSYNKHIKNKWLCKVQFLAKKQLQKFCRKDGEYDELDDELDDDENVKVITKHVSNY